MWLFRFPAPPRGDPQWNATGSDHEPQGKGHWKPLLPAGPGGGEPPGWLWLWVSREVRVATLCHPAGKMKRFLGLRGG